MASISFQNTAQTDIKVAKWTATLKVKVGVLILRIFSNNTRCPELETGRNSVKPCIIPNSIAS